MSLSQFFAWLLCRIADTIFGLKEMSSDLFKQSIVRPFKMNIDNSPNFGQALPDLEQSTLGSYAVPVWMDGYGHEL